MAPAPTDVEAPLDWQAIATRAGRDYARLRSAIGDRLDAIGQRRPQAAVEDVRSMPGSSLHRHNGRPGPHAAGAEPGQTDRHSIHGDDGVREIARGDRLAGRRGAQRGLWQRPCWTSTCRPGEAADQVILLTFQPEVAGVGGGILEALGSAGAFVPHLSVAGTDRAGSPFPVRGATDIFSGEGVAGPELARLRLEVGVTVPGRDPVVSRLLVDRLHPVSTLRAALPAGLALLPTAADAAGPVDLQSIRHIMVSVGAASPWLAARDRVDVISFANELLLDPDAASSFDFDALFWPIAVTDQALVLGSERTSIASIDAADDVRAFVSEPRVFIVTISGDPCPAVLRPCPRPGADPRCARGGDGGVGTGGALVWRRASSRGDGVPAQHHARLRWRDRGRRQHGDSIRAHGLRRGGRGGSCRCAGLAPGGAGGRPRGRGPGTRHRRRAGGRSTAGRQ
jgi:hypothetical protein